MNLDKFTGEFRPNLRYTCFGFGEYGYEITIFDTHDEKEAQKALEAFKLLVYRMKGLEK